MADDPSIIQTPLQRAARHKDLADQLAAQGKVAQALQHYRDALGLRPDYFEVHANLGNLLLATGQVNEALVHYREAADLRPDIAALHDNLGNAFRISGDPVSAVSCHEEALRLQPRLLAAHVNLGNALADLGRSAEAIELFEQALQLAPETPEAHCSLGNARQEQGLFDSALAHYREATRLRPHFIEAVIGEFNVMMKLGDREEARRFIQPYAGMQKKDPWITLAFSRLAQSDDERRTSLAELEGLLNRSVSNKNELGKLYFRLGDLCDALHSHEQAFEYYRKANELRPQDFNRGRYRQYIDHLLSVFDQDHIHSLPSATNDSELPVFIVGMPRAGKTLTEQILASHPQITGAGELGYIKEIAESINQLTDQTFPMGMEQLSVDHLNDMAEGYLSQLREKALPGSLRVIDTMPNNIHMLGLIRKLFPRGRIIHCIRDPLDTCLECYFKNFRRRYSYTNDLEDLGFHYQHYQRLSRHWRDLAGFPLLEVRYEELVKHPEKVSRGILDYLGLPWNSRCLDFHTRGNARLTGAFEIHEPINTHSIGHWKHYQQHIQPLVRQLGDTERGLQA